MSAYAALKSGEALTHLTSSSEETAGSNEDLDDEILKYTKGSDDEKEDNVEDNENGSENTDDTNSNENWNFKMNDTKQKYSNPDQTGVKLYQHQNLVLNSNFSPSIDNLSFHTDYVYVTLCEAEHILINGQFKMEVLEGSVLLNNCFTLNSKSNKIYQFQSSQTQAIPMISYLTTELDDKKNISIVKITNFENGLEKLNRIYPFASTAQNEQKSVFEKYTFELVLHENDNQFNGLYIPESWSDNFKFIASSAPSSVMVIGNKNTGKSTYSKVLMDYLLVHKRKSVVLIDIDPGQSEQSSPYCMSLTNHTTASFIEQDIDQNKVEYYYGFSSPMDSPSRFLNIVQRLYNHYLMHFSKTGTMVIVNTPGWVKGCGKELLLKVSNIICPSNLILLTNNLSTEYEENQNILCGLRFERLNLVNGIFSNQIVSASEIRCIHKLMYFHKVSGHEYDFTSRILDFSPTKLSYCTKENEVGINALSILNYELKFNGDLTTTRFLIESMIWSIHIIEAKKIKIPHIIQSGGLPMLLSAEHANSIINEEESKFLGLSIVHSLNNKDQYLNIYAPPNVTAKLQKYLNSDFKILFIRGEGNLPSPEVLHPNFLHENSSATKKYVPYLSFKVKPKVGGIWKVRRNIIRKSQR
ncbi:GRC3 [Candida pseudojiufengensis]|uniref:GRC3 n=1 Tax=Candida pseudojiufengensis TaxID=497109 RepID=UPI002224A130|nr:GRC3 [Candida pseudojiufengensis]KAI5962595.1 GRC3 [Candida pseudojiufengensis]